MNRFNFIVLSLIIVVLLPCSILAAQKTTSIADKIEPITSQKQQQQQKQQSQQIQQQQQAAQDSLPNRSPFLDSLFNIPIQTLRAVNELVQGLAGSVQGVVSASQRRPLPPRLQQRQFIQDENANGIL